jgi:hypothetical protein
MDPVGSLLALGQGRQEKIPEYCRQRWTAEKTDSINCVGHRRMTKRKPDPLLCSYSL